MANVSDATKLTFCSFLTRSECFQDELNTVCSNLGGKIWNRDYCILDDYYTVVGPVCWKGACWGSLENDCKAVGGTKIGRWCLVKGCDYTGKLQ